MSIELDDSLTKSQRTGQMKALGIHLAKGQLRYAVLDGTASNPTLVAKDRLITTDPGEVPALMDWFDTRFHELLESHRPERVGYRLTLEPKKDQLFSSEFPLGILNLQAFQRGLPIFDYTPGTFVPSRLGEAKDVDLEDLCTSRFGDNPPYWDKNQKYAVLAAWFSMKEQ